jgi:hypothetical protein
MYALSFGRVGQQALPNGIAVLLGFILQTDLLLDEQHIVEHGGLLVRRQHGGFLGDEAGEITGGDGGHGEKIRPWGRVSKRSTVHDFMPKYIVTIGLEVHAQLTTQSKMFCACPVEYGAEPNTHTCPTCLGLPGALPVLNAAAIEKTILTGMMLGCETPPLVKWDRKNYFYPDMPKNYQITPVRSAAVPRRRRAAL